MKQHILLEKAHRYDSPRQIDYPDDCTYQKEKGYWTVNSTGHVMMESPKPKPPVTKKADRETGEDQKGE